VRVVIFCHSLVSDWNHGNAHFLRGIAQELLDRDCDVHVLEPADGWSRTNLVNDLGQQAIDRFHHAYPRLRSESYDLGTLDIDQVLQRADLVLVHEWTDHTLVGRIGQHRAAGGRYVLLFHDTHHRSVTDPASMAAYDLTHYDGVLAFGDSVRDTYLQRGWASRAWTWHEAADTRVFFPRVDRAARLRPENGEAASTSRSGARDDQGGASEPSVDGDLVWVGNWGDEERTAELEEFLFTPIKRLGLRASVFGVRYPETARARLAADGITYGGWLPNHLVPEVFARCKATVHIPRRPYLEALPGIPTIRPFEALACGIPLVSARWDQTAGLFAPGEDFLVAHDGDEMTRHLAALMADESLRTRLAAHGLATVLSRHTCGHRVEELMNIYGVLRSASDEALRVSRSGSRGADRPGQSGRAEVSL
jgi:spore maturation protein CgeB